tara:strand:- start:7764 stop:7937 length:174 start_codon:yes stop_codon:yes gene_type:complete
MKMLFPIIAILSFIFAVGAIEDCGGHCMGQENWPMFFVFLTTGVIFSGLTLVTQKQY